VDLTEAQATEQLIGAGLKIEVKNVNGDEETKGRVTEQDPAAQTEVNVGVLSPSP
jgi:beta-lactam-binding protein with PASTA domain